MESVWNYPRPPALEACARRVRVLCDGRTIADSTRALRVLETSHPPVVYVPEADVEPGALAANPRTTVCEFKGRAAYYDVLGRPGAAWTYPEPRAGYERLAGHVAFYPGRMDACFLGEERVQAQEGDFYGGWITADVTGPFKGAVGTWGW